MHPVLFHLGRFPVPTYGVIAFATFVAGMLLVRHYAGVEGLDRRRVMDAIFYTVIAGLVGARLVDLVLNWNRFVAAPTLSLSSAGAYMAGLLTAVAFAVLWFRHVEIPLLLGLDFVGLFAALAMGMGRWGCFASGCCWGTPTDLPWAVTFPEIARQLHPELPALPLHPTQVYLALNSLVILGFLALAYRRKRFHGQIAMLYLILYGMTRSGLDFLRGDVERIPAFGGLLARSQLVTLAVALAATAAYLLLSRRHRRSGAPDWQPARDRPPDPPTSSRRRGRKARR